MPRLMDCPARKSDPKGVVLDIPTTALPKFNAIVDKLLERGPKIVKTMLGGKVGTVRHAAAAIGLGNEILYFDPNEAELLFDRAGFNYYCVAHWGPYDQYCKISYYKVVDERG
jgi:hypothetical protein